MRVEMSLLSDGSAFQARGRRTFRPLTPRADTDALLS